VALLPGAKPYTTSSDTAAEPSTAAATLAAAAPLLLLPLLVLPEAAAAEIQQAWQAAAAAAAALTADSAPAGPADDDATVDIAADESSTVAGLTAAAASDDELAAAWSGVVASLTVDIAYVLSACSASNDSDASVMARTCSNYAAAEQAVPLPAGVSGVLCNVLQHLAACGMFYTMSFLVQAATEAMTDKAASANNSAAASSSSADTGGAAAACKGVRTAAVSAVQPASASLVQLLCGLADPALESRFMAATFRNAVMLDLVTAVYCFAMWVGCWFAAGGRHTTPQQQQQHVAAELCLTELHDWWSLKLVWSVAVVLLLNTSTSVAVWLLRLRVAVAAKQQCSQHRHPPSSACSSSKAQLSSADEDTAAQQMIENAVYAQAGFQRQRLLALCIVQMVVLNLLCATGAVVTPGMATRACGLQGWAQSAAGVMGLSVQGWMYQVRVYNTLHHKNITSHLIAFHLVTLMAPFNQEWKPKSGANGRLIGGRTALPGMVVPGGFPLVPRFGARTVLWACRGPAAAALVAQELMRSTHSCATRTSNNEHEHDLFAARWHNRSMMHNMQHIMLPNLRGWTLCSSRPTTLHDKHLCCCSPLAAYCFAGAVPLVCTPDDSRGGNTCVWQPRVWAAAAALLDCHVLRACGAAVVGGVCCTQCACAQAVLERARCGGCKWRWSARD
jgi:hypothetical protein